MADFLSKRFLETVVRPNIELADDDPGDERHMANAILTLDACIGMAHRDLINKSRENIPEKDDKYRDLLSSRSIEYEILRDLAASYKHGMLEGRKPRLVTLPSQLSAIENQIGTLQCGDRLGGNVLMIETLDDEVRATDVLLAALRLALDIAKELPET